MESLLFMLNSIAMVVLIVMSLRDDRRDPGDPHTSFFRMTPAAPPRPDPNQQSTSTEELAWDDWTAAGLPGEVSRYGDRQAPLR